MQRALAVAVGLALLLCGRDAQVSKTYYEKITLDQVVPRADLIVVARPATPPSVTTQISIAPPGQKTSDKYPAYSRVQSRWTVVEALKGVSKPGTILVVDRAEWRSALELHRKYYLEGISKSPIYERYARLPGSGPIEPERILFLQRRAKELEFVAEGSQELVEHRAEVEKLLEKR